MYKIKTKSYFDKKFKKITKNNLFLQKRIPSTIKVLRQDPKYPGLHSHKVHSALGDYAWSIRVTGDIRIIWDYHPSEIDTLLLLDLGSHTGRLSVYK
jgi:mRNA-degrading endonuclease YafQ of YafQ-DinJ toxin-antitoxin module